MYDLILPVSLTVFFPAKWIPACSWTRLLRNQSWVQLFPHVSISNIIFYITHNTSHKNQINLTLLFLQWEKLTLTVFRLRSPEPEMSSYNVSLFPYTPNLCLVILQFHVLLLSSIRRVRFDPRSNHGPSTSSSLRRRHCGHPPADVSGLPRPPAALRRMDSGALSPASLLWALLLGGGVEGAWLLSGRGQQQHGP